MKGIITYGNRMDKSDTRKSIHKSELYLVIRISEKWFGLVNPFQILKLSTWFKSLTIHTGERRTHHGTDIVATFRKFGFITATKKIGTFYPGSVFTLAIVPHSNHVEFVIKADGSTTVTKTDVSFDNEGYNFESLKLSENALQSIKYDYKTI